MRHIRAGCHPIYPASPCAILPDHLALEKYADDAGFSALWMREKPFYNSRFGDIRQMLHPMAYSGFLTSQTKRIRSFRKHKRSYVFPESSPGALP